MPIVVVVAFAVGVVIYWIAVDRVIGRPILMSLLATFACNMILIGIGTALWTTSPYNIPVSLPGISWQGYTFTGTHMMAAAIAGLIAGLLYLFLNHARYGKAIRAVASNREAAELSGIPTKQVLALTFGLGVALACAAGALIATLFPFTVLSGSNYQLKSFVVTVLGGLGNPAGALLGGIALGLIEGLATPFMPVSWTPIIEFALFVIVLVAFPRGIFALSRA
jgi:branched-subunit amino acid ABC-type transport system permease component